MKYECEAGHMLDPTQQCYHCGAMPGPQAVCLGPKPRRVKTDLDFANERIVALTRELNHYREREKSMGWNQS